MRWCVVCIAVRLCTVSLPERLGFVKQTLPCTFPRFLVWNPFSWFLQVISYLCFSRVLVQGDQSEMMSRLCCHLLTLTLGVCVLDGAVCVCPSRACAAVSCRRLCFLHRSDRRSIQRERQLLQLQPAVHTRCCHRRGCSACRELLLLLKCFRLAWNQTGVCGGGWRRA